MEVLRQLDHAWSVDAVRLGTDPVGRAEDAGDVLESYSLVLTNGTAADAHTWIDPELLARFLPLFRISSQRRSAWAVHLKSLGYTVDGAVEVTRAVV